MDGGWVGGTEGRTEREKKGQEQEEEEENVSLCTATHTTHRPCWNRRAWRTEEERDEEEVGCQSRY